MLPINADYVFLLTTGYTEDPCGRIIEDHLVPDVRVDGIADQSITTLLAVPAIRDWLAAQAAETGRGSPGSVATGRCAVPRRSSGS